VLGEVYKKQESGKKFRDTQPKNLRGIDEIQVDERDRRYLERLMLGENSSPGKFGSPGTGDDDQLAAGGDYMNAD
jgi:hypothetical protein